MEFGSFGKINKPRRFWSRHVNVFHKYLHNRVYVVQLISTEKNLSSVPTLMHCSVLYFCRPFLPSSELGTHHILCHPNRDISFSNLSFHPSSLQPWGQQQCPTLTRVSTHSTIHQHHCEQHLLLFPPLVRRLKPEFQPLIACSNFALSSKLPWTPFPALPPLFGPTTHHRMKHVMLNTNCSGGQIIKSTSSFPAMHVSIWYFYASSTGNILLQ